MVRCGVGRGEERRHRAALGDAEHDCPLGADRVHHGAHVVHARLQVGQAIGRDPVGEARAALVEEDEPPHRSEPPVEAGELRVLPAGLEGADPAVHEHEVERPLADDLVGDPDVAAARVARYRRHRASRRPGDARPRAIVVPRACRAPPGRASRSCRSIWPLELAQRQPTARSRARRRASAGTPGSSRAPPRACPTGRGRACAASEVARAADAERSASRARPRRRGDARGRGPPRSAIRARPPAAPRDARPRAARTAPRTRPAPSAPERERVAQQRSRLLGLALRERPASAGDRALEAGEVELVVCRPRAGSPEHASAAAPPAAPCAAARRGSAPSSVPIPARPRPTGRRRAGRGRRCGWRAAAGPPAAPAACPPRSATARGRRRPLAGRGAGSPSREAADAITVAASRPVRARASVRWCNSEGSAGALRQRRTRSASRRRRGSRGPSWLRGRRSRRWRAPAPPAIEPTK